MDVSAPPSKHARRAPGERCEEDEAVQAALSRRSVSARGPFIMTLCVPDRERGLFFDGARVLGRPASAPMPS